MCRYSPNEFTHLFPLKNGIFIVTYLHHVKKSFELQEKNISISYYIMD